MPWGWAILAAVAATSALSQYQSGKAEAKSMSAQADIYHQQAQRRREIAGIEEQRNRSKLSRIQGLQRARLGATGVAPNTGSPLLLQAETAREGTLQILLERAVADNEASMIEHQGNLTRWQARERRKEADRALLVGLGEAGSYGYKGFGGSGPPNATRREPGTTLGSPSSKFQTGTYDWKIPSLTDNYGS